MYGVPSDLPLKCLCGSEVIQVCLGEAQVILHFHPAADITIEGHWELFAANGSILDSKQAHATRECYRLHAILGIPVVSFRIDSPAALTLMFQSGHTLTIYDGSSHYESCTISLPDHPMIII
jgi:hypothetical protein